MLKKSLYQEISDLLKKHENGIQLRYGENPHQQGYFHGDLSGIFDIFSNKTFSYTNLIDIEAGIKLIEEFDDLTFAILKHTNACGVASRKNVFDAWQDALASDPVSVLGGILVTNGKIDLKTAKEINKIFFVAISAADYEPKALDLLRSKPNRIILRQKEKLPDCCQFRSVFNGVIIQEPDNFTETIDDMMLVTKKSPTPNEFKDLEFANKIAKHTRTSSVAIVKNKQLLATGINQTSRVDALREAIQKAQSFGFNLEGSVMASEAFFPFSDTVQIAYSAGIKAILQPGGSIRDQESVDYCNKMKIAMVFTGKRHFKY